MKDVSDFQFARDIRASNKLATRAIGVLYLLFLRVGSLPL